MITDIKDIIAKQLQLAAKAVENTIALLDEGCTIPFISRYRKEKTGGLDEVQIGSISQLYDKMKELIKRKETIIKTINELGKMTKELQQRIDDCWDSTELEDIYLPYKPKRRTRAQVARELGLEPLATAILLQREQNPELCQLRRIVIKDTGNNCHRKEQRNPLGLNQPPQNRMLRAEKEVEEKLSKELRRLEKQPFGSAEAAVSRNYLDVCLELPWTKKSKERLNVDAARKILDADHYGLDKVKERILEFLAVKQLAPELRGQIICLYGPPGVGKTSVAASIARAMNRKMARVSLGGVHDEAEIRGHRKTYARRDRQAGGRPAQRPSLCPPGGAGRRAEQHLPGPFPGAALRPV